MEGLTKFDAIYVVLVFLVPGYVFLSFRNLFVAGQPKLTKDQILSYVTISGVNFTLCGWIIYLAYSNNCSVPIKAASWVIVIILLPAIAGIVWGTFNQRNVIRRLYHWVGLTPIHTIPNAWDYKFSRPTGEWVLVKLKNGIQFAGFWGTSSFASDDPKERDLLIERVYTIPDDGPWQPTDKSLLITQGEISTIEFVPVKGVNNG